MWVREIFLREVFWAWVEGVLLRGAHGRALEGARGTAKRAAGTDAGVMGRDASVWSGSWSFCSGCGCGHGIDPDKNDFIRAWLLDRKANANATANTTASA